MHEELFLMRIAGVVLTLGYYLSMLILLGNYAAKALIWTQSKPLNETVFRKPSVKTFVMAVCDILSFRRLLIANDLLWIGEWIFHVSFVFVMLRHLRYFLDPVPQWVWSVQFAGILAGYILPVSLVYILTVKFRIEKKMYFSSYNFLLLALIFALSVSGLLMKTIFHPDIVSVKTFTMGMVTFAFAAVPASALFIFHFIAFLALIVNLPTHIFAAPLSLISARERDENINQVIHEK
jgi:[DsrC]-trisulfide reductase subunit M